MRVGRLAQPLPDSTLVTARRFRVDCVAMRTCGSREDDEAEGKEAEEENEGTRSREQREAAAERIKRGQGKEGPQRVVEPIHTMTRELSPP